MDSQEFSYLRRLRIETVSVGVSKGEKELFWKGAPVRKEDGEKRH